MPHHPSRTRTRSALAALGVALAATVLAGCGSGDEAAAKKAPPGADTTAPTIAEATFPVDIVTAGGTVTVPARPTRIVSLSPTATEMLFALGAGGQVVAVDDQSNFPPEAPRTDLSGFTPNLEAIAGFTPDLVLVSNDTGGLVEGLSQLQIPTAVLPAATTLDDTYDQIEQLGAATGNLAAAAAVVASMRAEIDATVKKVRPRAEPLTYFHELDNTYFTATSNTFIGAVYARAGLRNIADAAGAGAGDYPQLTSEAIVTASPDLIFLADTKCCQQSPATVAARPGWGTIAAVRNGGVVALDDDVASRWGPRVVDLVGQVVAAVNAVPDRAPAPAAPAGR